MLAQPCLNLQVLCALCPKFNISLISSTALLNGYQHFSANFGVKALVRGLNSSHCSDLWRYLAVESPTSAGLGDIRVEMLDIKFMAPKPDHQSINCNPISPSPNIALWLQLGLWTPSSLGSWKQTSKEGSCCCKCVAHTLMLLFSVWNVGAEPFQPPQSSSLGVTTLRKY